MKKSSNLKMKNQTDDYYIKQTLNGNVNAYAFLVEKYKNMVFTLTLRITKNTEDAEEIAQDVFVKAYKKLNTFKGESKFSTWIYKIAYFASLDLLKKNKRMVSFQDVSSLKNMEIETVSNGIQYLHENERKKVIKEALLKLEEDERTIVSLYYFEELPLKEVAEIVNLRLDNVKVKLFRCRKKLAFILKNVIDKQTMDLI